MHDWTNILAVTITIGILIFITDRSEDMTREEALFIGKVKADNWYKCYKTRHTTKQNIDKLKNLFDKYKTLIKE